MALGGGNFLAQNKSIPGAYINFVSASRADAVLSERGIAAFVLKANWNVGNVLHVTYEDLVSNAAALFGCGTKDDSLLPLREVLCEAREAIVYIPGSGARAVCDIAEARHAGANGNKIQIRVSRNTAWTAENGLMDIETYFDGVLADSQIGVCGLLGASTIQDNDFVEFYRATTIDLPGTYTLTGGSTGTVDTAAYQTGLDLFESERFHVLALDSEDTGLKALFVNYTKRMRDECGVKFQCVLTDCAAGHEGIVNVDDKRLVYWVAGALAGCEINECLTNSEYTGELAVTTEYTQTGLGNAIAEGRFVFHTVAGTPRVLMDINSNTSSALLANNQTVRVLDQIANDIAVLFREKYLGKIQNNAAGRLSFWNDVVHQHRELQTAGAIEEFTAEDIAVEAGADKSAVIVTDRVMPVGGMTKLYMTVTVV